MSFASHYHVARRAVTLAVALPAVALAVSAVPLLRALLKSQPLMGSAWMSLGAAHRGLGMPDSAIAAFEQERIVRASLGRLGSNCWW